jgi:hypothetical protein
MVFLICQHPPDWKQTKPTVQLNMDSTGDAIWALNGLLVLTLGVLSRSIVPAMMGTGAPYTRTAAKKVAKIFGRVQNYSIDRYIGCSQLLLHQCCMPHQKPPIQPNMEPFP